MAQWRTITADQYRTGEDEPGFDEAFIYHPETGSRYEIWDCGGDLYRGFVSIETSLPNPILVPPSYPIRVR